MFENSNDYTNTLISNSGDEKKIRGIGIWKICIILHMVILG
jgi:hypothetical protein